MLTRLIVDLYAWIIEISLWFMLLVAGIFGYHFTVPMLNSTGAILENEAVWQIYGAGFFAIGAFLLSAVVIGPFLLLLDIRKSVRALESKQSVGGRVGGGPPSKTVREPSLGE